MGKDTYEVIAESKVVNLDNVTVKTLKVGEEVTGEFVLIDDNPYVEVPEGYISTDGLAKKIGSDQTDLAKADATVKSSHKKLIFALVGAGVGFGIAHFMKYDMKKKVLFTIGGIALGLGIDYINNARKK